MGPILTPGAERGTDAAALRCAAARYGALRCTAVRQPRPWAPAKAEFPASGLPGRTASRVWHPGSGLRAHASGIRHPTSGIRHPASGAGVRGPASGIRRPTSGVRAPASGVRRPTSGIRHPASGIRPHARRQNLGGGLRVRRKRTATPGIRNTIDHAPAPRRIPTVEAPAIRAHRSI
ncbi:hypothetical protein [Microbacterium sp.]|uniref:hypothetical protein n=1 Tax=Microbacterium sp. TaxID=51671 RepID=UPI0035631939